VKYLHALSSKMERLAARKYMIPLGILFVVLLVIMQFGPDSIVRLTRESGGIGMLDMKFGYSQSQVIRMMENLGAEGRQLYIRILCIDFLFLTVFMLLLSALITVLLRAAAIDARWQTLNLLPIIRSVFDLLENVLLTIILIRFPYNSEALIRAACMMTILKWLAFFAMIAVIAVLCAWILRRRIASPNKKT
jgi:hypothetical protein